MGTKEDNRIFSSTPEIFRISTLVDTLLPCYLAGGAPAPAPCPRSPRPSRAGTPRPGRSCCRSWAGPGQYFVNIFLQTIFIFRVNKPSSMRAAGRSEAAWARRRGPGRRPLSTRPAARRAGSLAAWRACSPPATACRPPAGSPRCCPTAPPRRSPRSARSRNTRTRRQCWR